MEYSFVDLETYKGLKKLKTLLICLCVLIAFLFAVFCLLAGLFQNRDTALYWIIGGSIVTFIFLFVESYILLMPFRSVLAYIAFFDKALSKPRLRNEVTIVGIKKEKETYQGMETKSIEVFENDENEVWEIRYFAESRFEPKIEGRYIVETYDDVLMRIEEI